MHNFSSCVLDTSVIIKALFSPSHRESGTIYSREVTTHKSCVALLRALDEQGIRIIIPWCGIIEIAAVSKRLSDSSHAEQICDEVETNFTIVPEERIIPMAKRIALDEGCPGFDTYFLALAEQDIIPLFTDDLGMHRMCSHRKIQSWLVRDLDPASLFP